VPTWEIGGGGEIEWWSGGILRYLQEPQIARGKGAEWQWIARQDELRTGIRMFYTRKETPQDL
jgi:hypothetical protein